MGSNRTTLTRAVKETTRDLADLGHLCSAAPITAIITGELLALIGRTSDPKTPQ